MFCKNCGNKLEDNDKICSVCGNAVDLPENVIDKIEEVDNAIAQDHTQTSENDKDVKVKEDVKTPLFDFRWDIQDFPSDEKRKTEEIDFRWETIKKEEPLVEKMKGAVDPEEIADTPIFSDEEFGEEEHGDQWYDPFSLKDNTATEALFKFNKRNEEFQKQLDQEFEKYSSIKKPDAVDVSTKRYSIEDFKDKSEAVDKEADDFDKFDKEEDKTDGKTTCEETIEEGVIDIDTNKQNESKDDILEEKKALDDTKQISTEENQNKTGAEILDAFEPVNVLSPNDLKHDEEEPPQESSSNRVAGIGLFDSSIISPIANDQNEEKKNIDDESSSETRTEEAFSLEDIELETEPYYTEERENGEENESKEDTIADSSQNNEEKIDNKDSLLGGLFDVDSISSSLFGVEPQSESVVSESEPTDTTVEHVRDQDDTSASAETQKEVGSEQEETEDKDTYDGPAFLDTSFVSPFGNNTANADASTQKVEKPEVSIDEDEFLKDLPAGDGVETKEENQGSNQPQNAEVAQNSSENDNACEPENNKIIGPEIVNEPVVFPFELNEEEKQPVKTQNSAPQKEELIDRLLKEDSDFGKTPEIENKDTELKTKVKKDKSKDISGPIAYEQPKSSVVMNPFIEEEKPKKNKGFIVAMVIIIAIIALIIAGICVMKFLPESSAGQYLNNSIGSVFGANNDTKTEKTITPSQNLTSIISQKSSENKNIGSITYDETLKYDETSSYAVEGANSSTQMANNYWKSNGGKDVLFDEQIISTLIGYNSSWVDYLNKADQKVFEYILPDSDAESTLKQEALKDGSQLIYKDLNIGEIRQNGDAFFVWTNETIALKDKKGKETSKTLDQLYKLEPTADTMQISTYVTL